MGMYNEVFKSCPRCNGQGYMQIHQIVLGFGGFSLDNPSSIADELDEDQIKELVEAVKETKWFRCENCKESFSINDDEETTSRKIEMITNLFKK